MEAIHLYETALASRIRTHGEQHASVAETLTNLAVAHEATGDRQQALQEYERALEIARATLPAGDELRAHIQSRCNVLRATTCRK